jgi:RNA polymerase sigma factor (sigma-70 family)
LLAECKRSSVASREVAEELIADAYITFLRLYNENLVVKTLPTTYIFSTLKCNIIDYYRTQKRREQRELKISSFVDDEGNEYFALPTQDIDSLEMNDNKDLVDKALLSIKNDTVRAIVELRLIRELSYNEISEQLQISMEKVKNYLFKGKQEIKAYILSQQPAFAL